MVGYGGTDLQKRKVLSLEWKSEGVMDDESGESMQVYRTTWSMEPMELVSYRIVCVSLNSWLYTRCSCSSSHCIHG